MLTINTNHSWLKTITMILAFCVLMMTSVNTVADDAIDRGSAIDEYKEALIDMGYEGDSQSAAEGAVDSTITAMENSQFAISDKLEELKNRVDSMHMKDTRKDKAKSKLNTADSKVSSFKSIDPSTNLSVDIQIGGVIPRVLPHTSFIESEKEASDALNAVNRVLIAPSKPGSVPEGDILEDFVPQLVRQLFRFAWLAVFISFLLSGIMLVVSFDNEERISRAKRMIYFTLLGFTFVSLAFAIVKAITDIDFFGFI